MAETNIEWADFTYNPWIGCTKVSPGCVNCYAATLDRNRYSKTLGGGTKANPISHWGKGAPRHRTSTGDSPLKWDRIAGKSQFLQCPGCGWRGTERELDVQEGGVLDGMKACPECDVTEVFMQVVRPRVFCASLADWLDEEVPLEWLAHLLNLIRATPHLDWLLLTKRPQNFRPRLEQIIERLDISLELTEWAYAWIGEPGCRVLKSIAPKPPANVWVGTSVEDQTRAEERIPLLLSIPAAVRFLSCEPLLELVDLDLKNRACPECGCATSTNHDHIGPGFRQCADCGQEWWIDVKYSRNASGIHWVICGGESGSDVRPMHPAWARSLRDQCAALNVPYLFKQWGEWAPGNAGHGGDLTPIDRTKIKSGFFDYNDRWNALGPNPFRQTMDRLGKDKAGRLLDGIEHNGFPAVERSAYVG